MKKLLFAIIGFLAATTLAATPAEAQWGYGGDSNESVTRSTQQPLPGGGYASRTQTQSVNMGNGGWPTVSNSGHETVTQIIPGGGSQTVSRSYSNSGPGGGYPAYGGHHGYYSYGPPLSGGQVLGAIAGGALGRAMAGKGNRGAGTVLGVIGGLILGGVLERATAPQPVAIAPVTAAQPQPVYTAAPAVPPPPPQPQYWTRCDSSGYCVQYPK